MASLARHPSRAAWSVEECARFAALKEYELLQLLSRDKKAPGDGASTRPQLLSSSTDRNRPHPQSLLVLERLRLRRHRLPLLQRHLRRRQIFASGAVLCVAQSATQLGEAQLCTRSMLSLLFVVRLRCIVNSTLGLPGGPGDVGASSGSAKRGSAESPSSGCSSSSSGSSICSSTSGMRMVTPEEFFSCPALPQGRREQKKQKGGLFAGFLLK